MVDAVKLSSWCLRDRDELEHLELDGDSFFFFFFFYQTASVE